MAIVDDSDVEIDEEQIEMHHNEVFEDPVYLEDAMGEIQRQISLWDTTMEGTSGLGPSEVTPDIEAWDQTDTPSTEA